MLVPGPCPNFRVPPHTTLAERPGRVRSTGGRNGLQPAPLQAPGPIPAATGALLPRRLPDPVQRTLLQHAISRQFFRRIETPCPERPAALPSACLVLPVDCTSPRRLLCYPAAPWRSHPLVRPIWNQNRSLPLQGFPRRYLPHPVAGTRTLWILHAVFGQWSERQRFCPRPAGSEIQYLLTCSWRHPGAEQPVALIPQTHQMAVAEFLLGCLPLPDGGKRHPLHFRTGPPEADWAIGIPARGVPAYPGERYHHRPVGPIPPSSAAAEKDRSVTIVCSGGNPHPVGPDEPVPRGQTMCQPRLTACASRIGRA